MNKINRRSNLYFCWVFKIQISFRKCLRLNVNKLSQLEEKYPLVSKNIISCKSVNVLIHIQILFAIEPHCTQTKKNKKIFILEITLTFIFILNFLFFYFFRYPWLVPEVNKLFTLFVHDGTQSNKITKMQQY